MLTRLFRKGGATMDSGTQTTFEVAKTDEQWRAELTPEQYAVLRRAGTEPAFSGAYTDTEDPGLYKCAACSNPLFRNDTKFHSGSGWPSFYQPIADGAIVERADSSHFMVRTEVQCGRCGGHLGHVFDDGPAPTGQRYCMNSVSLELDHEQA